MDVFVIFREKSEENSKSEIDVVWQSIRYSLKRRERKKLARYFFRIEKYSFFRHRKITRSQYLVEFNHLHTPYWGLFSNLRSI